MNIVLQICQNGLGPKSRPRNCQVEIKMLFHLVFYVQIIENYSQENI